MTRVASLPPVIAQNPYQRLLYAALVEEGLELEPRPQFRVRWLIAQRRRVRILHFHWPQTYYRHEGAMWTRRPLSWVRICLFAVRLGAARALGYRIAWTVHQPQPHESAGGRLDTTAGALLVRASHVLLVHDRATADEVGARWKRSRPKVEVVPHGSYIGVYREGRSRTEVRAALGLSPDDFVFLCFGHVRAYKELEVLLDAFRRVERRDVALVVAGLPLDEASRAAVLAAAGADDRIKAVLEFVPDEQVAELFHACDATVLPRGDGGTSGALVLSLSLGVPAAAADTPAYAELLGDEEAGWLFSAGDAESLATTLERAAHDRPLATAKARAALRIARSLAWEPIAQRTAALLRGDGELADVLLVSSTGGHLLQLLSMQGAWERLSRYWVTEDASDTRSLLKRERALFAHPPASRHAGNFFRDARLAWRVLSRVRPAAMVTTGAAIAVPFAWVARLRGVPVVFIETITRVDEPSLSCRLVAPVADRLYVQWPELARRTTRARYVGGLLARR